MVSWWVFVVSDATFFAMYLGLLFQVRDMQKLVQKLLDEWQPKPTTIVRDFERMRAEEK